MKGGKPLSIHHAGLQEGIYWEKVTNNVGEDYSWIKRDYKHIVTVYLHDQCSVNSLECLLSLSSFLMARRLYPKVVGVNDCFSGELLPLTEKGRRFPL